METELVSTLISLVQSTAPELWAIARQQVLAQRISMLVWSTVLIVAVLILFSQFRKFSTLVRREKCWIEKENYQAIRWACFMVATVLVFVLIGLITESLGRHYNPDYYALKTLIDLIR